MKHKGRPYIFFNQWNYFVRMVGSATVLKPAEKDLNLWYGYKNNTWLKCEAQNTLLLPVLSLYILLALAPERNGSFNNCTKKGSFSIIFHDNYILIVQYLHLGAFGSSILPLLPTMLFATRYFLTSLHYVCSTEVPVLAFTSSFFLVSTIHLVSPLS